jgi:hypothetical protein
MLPEFYRLISTYATNDRDVFFSLGLAAFILLGYQVTARQPYRWIANLYTVICLALYLFASTLIAGVLL